MIVKATHASEAGVMPTEAQIAEMGPYNEQLAKAGVLVDSRVCSRRPRAPRSASPAASAP